MNEQGPSRCTAFKGNRRIASGDLPSVALATKEIMDRGGTDPILIFDDATGRLVEVDLRGTRDEVAERLLGNEQEKGAATGASSPRGPGRPRLGVVSKEVTLLPRHWAWLRAQRGGASATLRRLVDESRKANEEGDEVRQAQDTTYHFLSAIVGNQPGFEEAIRALYAGNRERFENESEGWPRDLRTHGARLAAPVWR